MDYFLGMIKLFPYDFIPMGWAKCNGSTMQILQNQALYALIGIQFGGDGKTTFALPNLTNATTQPSKLTYCIATMGIFPVRS
jgi:microcystin-dependent protein